MYLNIKITLIIGLFLLVATGSFAQNDSTVVTSKRLVKVRL